MPRAAATCWPVCRCCLLNWIAPRRGTRECAKALLLVILRPGSGGAAGSARSRQGPAVGSSGGGCVRLAALPTSLHNRVAPATKPRCAYTNASSSTGSALWRLTSVPKQCRYPELGQQSCLCAPRALAEERSVHATMLQRAHSPLAPPACCSEGGTSRRQPATGSGQQRLTIRHVDTADRPAWRSMSMVAGMPCLDGSQLGGQKLSALLSPCLRHLGFGSNRNNIIRVWKV